MINKLTEYEIDFEKHIRFSKSQQGVASEKDNQSSCCNSEISNRELKESQS